VITGIGVLKGRIKHGTLKSANDSTIILIPAKELKRLLEKLRRQLK